MLYTCGGVEEELAIPLAIEDRLRVVNLMVFYRRAEILRATDKMSRSACEEQSDSTFIDPKVES